MNIDTLRIKTAKEKEKLIKLKTEKDIIANFKQLSDDLLGACVNYYNKQIDDCELNICGYEERLYDGLNDAADIMAEMKGENNYD